MTMKNKTENNHSKNRKIKIAQSMFWANNLKYMAGKNFAELERELSSSPIEKKDCGGYKQPYAYSKYAAGSRIPTSPSESKDSPITKAEEKYWRSATAYNSIFWDLLSGADQDIDINKYLARIPNNIRIRLKLIGVDLAERNSINFKDEDFAKLVLIKDIDVLGLMILQIKAHKHDINYEHIFFIRNWILITSQNFEPFRICKKIIFEVIEENLPEIGFLNGIDGIDTNKIHSERVRESFIAAFLSGKTLKLNSTYRNIFN